MARMPDIRMPKQALFGHFKKARPFHGVKMRWKDRVRRDMLSLNIPKRWYSLAQDRKGWHDLCHAQMKIKIEQRIKKEEEKRQARRQVRRNATSQRQIQALFICQHCQRSFRRSGDLNRHKCASQNQTQIQTSFECQNCQRSFRRSGDLKRHSCDSVRSRQVSRRGN